MVLEPPIFYGFPNDNPWFFKNRLFDVDQLFAQVSLSEAKEKVWYVKMRVSGIDSECYDLGPL